MPHGPGLLLGPFSSFDAYDLLSTLALSQQDLGACHPAAHEDAGRSNRTLTIRQPKPSTSYLLGQPVKIGIIYDMSTDPLGLRDLDHKSRSPDSGDSRPEQPVGEEKLEGQEELAQLQKARQRLYSAAIAYCEGHISAGQLRAVRELLRAHEQHFTEKGEVILPPFIEGLEFENEDELQSDVVESPEFVESPTEEANTPDITPPAVNVRELAVDPDDPMQEKLVALEEKLVRLEEDIHAGRINPSQYQAISKHYEEQRTVAIRLRDRHPSSDQWRVVLEDGKTNFLMQIHEAVCYGVAFFGYKSHELLYLEGRLPDRSNESISFLGAFGGPVAGDQSERMYATQSEDGTTLLLIPGLYSAALVAFSKEPPEWQARALREVHRNFEYANRTTFERGLTRSLIFPNLSNFIRS